MSSRLRMDAVILKAVAVDVAADAAVDERVGVFRLGRGGQSDGAKTRRSDALISGVFTIVSEHQRWFGRCRDELGGLS